MKVSQLQAFNVVHEFDIICVSETPLDSSISKDDNALSTEGYFIIRADYPSNTKRGSVCIYNDEKISIREMNNISLPELTPFLQSCIDPIFTDHPNLVVNRGVKSSFHENCHHQITYAKFNLQMIYPPAYQRLVWDYKNANTSPILKVFKHD